MNMTTDESVREPDETEDYHEGFEDGYQEGYKQGYVDGYRADWRPMISDWVWRVAIVAALCVTVPRVGTYLEEIKHHLAPKHVNGDDHSVLIQGATFTSDGHVPSLIVDTRAPDIRFGTSTPAWAKLKQEVYKP